MIEEQGRKQIHAITNKNALTNKDDYYNDNYIEIFDKLVKERFDEIKK